MFSDNKEVAVEQFRKFMEQDNDDMCLEDVDDVIKSKHFIGYKAKENLLHMQKAILSSLQR